MRSCIVHLDVDAFFAAVEQIDNPSLCGKALIVGGSTQSRSVVASCSYEARSFGVHSAMPMTRALQLCPHAVLRPVRMRRYKECSAQLMKLLRRFAPLVHPASIDEAYLDFSNTESLYPDLPQTLSTMKTTIKNETGLNVSIGLASNWYIAKLASEIDKPNGFHIVETGTEVSFIEKFPLSKLWGIGVHTYKRLQQKGISDLASLRVMTTSQLTSLFGKSLGDFLSAIAQGKAPGDLWTPAKERIISTEMTLEKDILTVEDARPILMRLAQHLMHRLRSDGLSGSCIRIKYRLHDFTLHSIQKTYKHPELSTYQIYSQAVILLKKKWNEEEPLRLLGIAIGKVQAHVVMQKELFALSQERVLSLEQTVVSLTKKFGEDVLKPARSMQKKDNIDE